MQFDKHRRILALPRSDKVLLQLLETPLGIGLINREE
jgi:hypothetical protein